MAFPFDWPAWRRFYGSLAELRGPVAWREAAVRAGLAWASGTAWDRGDDAPPAQQPLVIVGHQRSGTTLLHRMLAAHPDAAAMPLHALVLPADSWQRRFDRPRPAWLDRLQDRVLGSLDDVHRIRLHEAEEDEFLLWSVFRSPMNALDRPWPAGGAPDIDGDELALRFYAQAIARSSRRSGRRHVGKNPHFSWRVDALRRAVPDVRIVALWRHPEAAVASRLSLIRQIWRRRGLAQELRLHDVERIIASSVRILIGALGAADLDLHYEVLVADPLATADRVHEAFGWRRLSTSARRQLAAGAHRAQPRHRYGLEEFGVRPSDLARRLAPVYDHFGYQPTP